VRSGGNIFNYLSENKLTKLANLVQFKRMSVFCLKDLEGPGPHGLLLSTPMSLFTVYMYSFFENIFTSLFQTLSIFHTQTENQTAFVVDSCEIEIYFYTSRPCLHHQTKNASVNEDIYE